MGCSAGRGHLISWTSRHVHGQRGTFICNSVRHTRGNVHFQGLCPEKGQHCLNPLPLAQVPGMGSQLFLGGIVKEGEALRP